MAGHVIFFSVMRCSLHVRVRGEIVHFRCSVMFVLRHGRLLKK
jgi:hypothetical protein